MRQRYQGALTNAVFKTLDYAHRIKFAHKKQDTFLILLQFELISTKDALLFYKKKGFEERPCEWDGPGMFKMIRIPR